ncbi:hypothetical protein CONPUDRAFT_150945 [Coniophora puteana RWD-64-598 SS2]|uniref:CxC1-like cysteine cluster associated with KDZ transposases domain-containing protein n=1 Tax=Coniophora puteana (strain RWD-64-598) TaxID=741705 RepID=A0A5M3MY04_CONPW|nr:uncharacterized protein CONPUDRAFT_150945 [Coniophora puteana RWD-64-598 SS2]EIW83897.1 hypothetical protein CONPUDRAFT_150945 [Coniophora puteana RWD-64-598 SS2]
MPASRNTGVSHDVDVVYGSSSRFFARNEQLKVTRQKSIHERRELQERLRSSSKGFSRESLQVLAEVTHDDDDDDQHHGFTTFEAHEDTQTSEGQWVDEDEDIATDEFMAAVQEHARNKLNASQDHRTWRHRLRRAQENLLPSIPGMTAGYLRWMYPPPIHTSSSPLPSDPTLTDTSMDSMDPPQPRTSSQGADWSFKIAVIDIYTLDTLATIPRSEDCPSTSEALASAGYIGTTPDSPTLAFSIRTLELYRRLRLRKASFSVEAFSKVICDLYAWSYRRTYRTALANAFDAYLLVRRRVDEDVQKALGRDGRDWRAKFGCPACGYEVNDEPPLKYRRMLTFDGNNSLSRMKAFGDRQVGDLRRFTGDYFLTTEEVDKFANGVQKLDNSDLVSDPGIGLDDDDDDAQGSTNNDAECTKNWKAAAADAKKNSWGIFDETGIFASACRHGIMLWVVDMVRSGELFKYPLATVQKALDVLGPRLMIAYDIGCKLKTTIKNSSLGPTFSASESTMCVDAFHGYTHNFSCQDSNHPSILEGAGLEDFGFMERIFSQSNNLTVLVRYASAFNRRLFISLYFTQWDKDRYLGIGYTLYRGYVRALRVIKADDAALVQAKVSLNITDAELEVWKVEQSQYLKTVGEEDEYDVFAVTYVELLQKLRIARAKADKHKGSYTDAIPDGYEPAPVAFVNLKAHWSDKDTSLSQTRKLETAMRRSRDRVDALDRDITDIEIKMGIARRWEPFDEDYIHAVEYVNKRKYHCALNKLQRLVVLRLLELHKLNLGRVGYKMRSHMGKSLQARCRAIRNAVAEYNAAAKDIGKPQLDWSKVSNYSFVEEFTLLQETRDDVRSKRWTTPVIREVMKLHSRLKRAHEEIARLDVEVRRVHTFIRDEENMFDFVVDELNHTKSPLSGAVQDFCSRRRRANACIMRDLQSIFELDGFSGSCEPGLRDGSDIGKAPSASPEPRARMFASQEPSLTETVDDALDVDDTRMEEMGGMVDWMSSLTVSH